MAATVKAYRGMGMEGSVARWYDRTTRNDMQEYRALAARIAAAIPSGGTVLEVAPGPGFLSIELARRGVQVRAVDISKTFVEIARHNAQAEGVTVRFEQGNAAALPVEDASVDFVVCRAAFKNFSEPVKALSEMRRVLRPGGTALLIDMRSDASPSELRPHADRMSRNWLHRQFMMFIFRSLTRRAYSTRQIQDMLREAGWSASEVNIEIASSGFEARMRKL